MLALFCDTYLAAKTVLMTGTVHWDGIPRDNVSKYTSLEALSMVYYAIEVAVIIFQSR